nr:pyridoxamine 5'-phosphate oxidase family protein [uncultured Desulfobulbus sp.]
MKLSQYFSNAVGTGVFSTADAAGVVNSAIYATPHIVDERNVQFIMRNRLSRANLQENGQACYLFMEKSGHGAGVRLYLRMTGEEQDEEKIRALSRRPGKVHEEAGDRFLVSFAVEKVRSLIGGEEMDLDP